MRILLLVWDFPPTRGGIQTWMSELAVQLPDAEVRVFAPGGPGDRAFDRTSAVRTSRLRTARLGRFAWFLELCLRSLLQCLTRRPDVIVCGHYIAAPAALLMWWLLRVPYVVFVYGHEIRRQRVRRLQQFLLKRASLVIPCSRFTRTAVLDLGVAGERARVLYPGVDVHRFFPASSGGVQPGSTILLTVSRLTDLYKGHDVVIRALPAIVAEWPNVRYVVAGDGPLREYLARLTETVGVTENVEFKGEVSDEVMVDLYRACDVFVLVSRESLSDGGAEGFGIVFLEAAACGKPVVAGRSGGIVDAVDDGKTGILVDPENVEAVAEAITSLLQDPARARRLGEAGRKMILQRFTWEHVLKETRQLFQEAAES